MVVIPAAYGGKPTQTSPWQASSSRNYVGFYFMLLYLDPALENKLSPSLKRLLESKTCFQITKLDPDLLKNIEAALSEDAKYYQHRSWL